MSPVAWPQIADVDDADLDTELVDALRDLSSMQDDVQQRRLDRIEGLPEAQLKPALRALLNSLSTEQLDELAATSSEEEEEDDDAQDEDDESGGGGGAARGGRAAHPPPGMRVVALDTARRRCFKGHELSAMLMRPPDYAGEGGPEEFVCDVCGAENYPPFLFQPGVLPPSRARLGKTTFAVRTRTWRFPQVSRTSGMWTACTTAAIAGIGTAV